jgi:F-type H+-transporting ATPase subunit delta
METTHHTPTVLSYAESVIELAEEQGQAEAVGREMAEVGQVLEQNPTFAQFLADPGISHAERDRVLADAFGNGHASPLVWNFIRVLNGKGRLGLLAQVVAAYGDLYDERHGKVELDVTVAQRLASNDLEHVRKEVGAALGKDAVVHQYVDESLIGGMILRVGDRLIDGSVKGQLDAIRKQMLAARPQ